MNDVCSGGICSGVPLDADGDGYVSKDCGGDDCDDSNPNVNPGATEGCCLEDSCFDGIDNNCNGLIDQQEMGCLMWCTSPLSAQASALGTNGGSGSRHMNHLAALLVPLAIVLVLKRIRRRR
jgi:hypothetical protein